MGEVAGVDDEIRCVTEVVDPIDRLVERARDIRIGFTQKSDVAVADLSESQSGPTLTARGVGGAGDVGDDFAADHRQADGRAEPCAVPDQLAPVHRVRRRRSLRHHHGGVHERVDRADIVERAGFREGVGKRCLRTHSR